jgi:hypothetical protein
LPAGPRATLAFLEVLTRRPGDLTAEDARAVLREGAAPEAIEDAIAITALFNVINNCGDTFDFAIPGTGISSAPRTGSWHGATYLEAPLPWACIQRHGGGELDCAAVVLHVSSLTAHAATSNG